MKMNTNTPSSPGHAVIQAPWIGRLLIALWLATASTISQAQLLYDATAEFSTNQNPAGVWSYGWMPTDFSRFTEYPTTFATAEDHHGWLDIAPGPHLWINQGAPAFGVPNGWLALHPGPNFEPSVLRWTCPIPGTARVRGQFLPGHDGIMQVGVRTGPQWLWKAEDSGEFDLNLALLAGQHLDFAVFGGYGAGNTPLEARIELVPTEDGIFLPSGNVIALESAAALILNIQRLSSTNSGAIVTVNFTTADGTAKAGEDYAAMSGLLTFTPGQTNQTVSIPILNDSVIEAEETFQIILSRPTPGTALLVTNMVIRIKDDDLPADWMDTFEVLEGWVPFGDPLPKLVSTRHGRTGLFDNNGDPNYDSGAVSKQRFDLSGGYVIESQVYLDFTEPRGCWAGAAFGIADPQYHDWGGYGAMLAMGLWAVGDACWAAPLEIRRHAGLGASYETDGGGTATLDDVINPGTGQTLGDRLANRWVTLTIIVSPDGYPSFLADGVEVWRGTKPVSARLRSGPGQLYLGSRSSGSAGKAYHDSIRFTHLDPTVQGVYVKTDVLTRGTWQLSTNAPVHQVVSSGNRALAIAGRTVCLLDVSNPTKPALLGTWLPFFSPSDIELAGNLAYIASYEPDLLSTIEIVDFTNPAKPVLRGYFDTEGHAEDIEVTGQTVYVADSDGGLLVLDVTDPAIPRRLGGFNTRGSVLAVQTAGPHAYCADGNWLLVLDISNPRNPRRVAVHEVAAGIRALQVRGTHLYVCDEAGDLQILDASRPASIQVLGARRGWGESAHGMAAFGRFLCLARGDEGLQVLDTSEPAEPSWLTVQWQSPAEDVALMGRHLLVAGGKNGLLVCNLHQELHPPLPPPILDGGTMTLRWATTNDVRLQMATNLANPIWQDVPHSEGTNMLTLPSASAKAFFRLVKGPKVMPGMVAGWSGDGDSLDIIGMSDGALRNGAAFAPGKAGQAFAFDGVDDYIEVPDCDLWAFGDSDFTIEHWVWFNSVRQSGSLIGADFLFVGTSEGSGDVNKWGFFTVGGVLTFIVDSPQTGPKWLARYPFLPTVRRWYHLAVTRERGRYTIYVDGVPVSSEANWDTIPNANAPLTLGQFEGIGYMDGLIDQVSIYHRALSAGEIKSIHDAGATGQSPTLP